MSKSRKRSRRSSSGSATLPEFALSTFSLQQGAHDAFKEATQAAAKASVDDFPKRLESLKDIFRQKDPLGLLAAATRYSLYNFIDRRGDRHTSPAGLLQHHIELLQAVLLTLPFSEWGVIPVYGDALETIFEALPKLADTFWIQRLAATDTTADEVTKNVLLLQERIRLNTQGVRNWGYYKEVLKISKELYAQLDNAILGVLGFSATEFIDVAAHLVQEHQNRIDQHSRTLAKVLRGKTVRQIVQLYIKYTPGSAADPEQILSSLPQGITRDGSIAFIINHSDLRLSEYATFTAEEVAKQLGMQVDQVGKILETLSMSPGELSNANPGHLFLSNPVWTRPIIRVGSNFFVAIPQAIFSHIHVVMHKLAEDSGLATQLENARSRYLEDTLGDALRQALPTSTIRSGVKWAIDGRQGETDALVVLDRTVLIAEAKSHRLTPEGLRGAPARMKRHVQDLILEPSLQSARLEAYIDKARHGETSAQKLMKDLGITAANVDYVIRISVTLDDLSVLSSAEGELKKIGWIPIDHELAPAIHIADLLCIISILDNPLHFLHYLHERTHFQKGREILGDELDFLGLYLSTGLNIPALEHGTYNFSGMSAPVDRYFDASEVGIFVPKPRPLISSLYAAITEKLARRRPDSWTTIGLNLLSSTVISEQREIERSLEKLRSSVRKTRHIPTHTSTMAVRPSPLRKAVVAFFLFPDTQRGSMRADAERIAAEMISDGQHRSCVLFARCIDNWKSPYDAVLFARRH